MCSSNLHWRRHRNASFKTTTLFKEKHEVRFTREFQERALVARCSCSWSVRVEEHDLPPTMDPHAAIREEASRHLQDF